MVEYLYRWIYFFYHTLLVVVLIMCILMSFWSSSTCHYHDTGVLIMFLLHSGNINGLCWKYEVGPSWLATVSLVGNRRSTSGSGVFCGMSDPITQATNLPIMWPLIIMWSGQRSPIKWQAIMWWGQRVWGEVGFGIAGRCHRDNLEEMWAYAAGLSKLPPATSAQLHTSYW